MNISEQLRATARQRIMVLDGAMGTMIQRENLAEQDYRGERFADFPRDLKGNNDLLSLTQPHIIRKIHDAYFAAGSDIVGTNTFNATSISMADYDMADLAPEINRAAASIARQAADAWTESEPDKPRYVAGAIGPTNRTASISPDVNNPGYRNVTFDELADAYFEQAVALIEAGVDILLIETVFDTLNAKAAGYAVLDALDKQGMDLPVMVSGTITDYSGRNLSGQTPEAFWYSVRHLKPLAIGLNCAFGAEQLRPALAEIGAVAECHISGYPNAGLPNELGQYDETPEQTAAFLEGWARDGLINFVGGCCGTTPDHIAAIARAVAPFPPREPREVAPKMRLSGLEPFVLG